MAIVSWRLFRADDRNLPAYRPGIYRIAHIATGRSYIGISRSVAKRLENHAIRNSPAKIRVALAKYGREGFLVEPLYYLIVTDDLSVLAQLERQLIRDYDALESGFNISEGSPPFGGAYGAEFREICRVAQNQPETKAKRRATNARPDVKARKRASMIAAGPKISESLRIRFTDPDIRRANVLAQQEAQSRPDVIAKKVAIAKANHQNPEYRVKYDAYFADKNRQAARLAAAAAALKRPDVVQKLINRPARNATGVKGVYPNPRGKGLCYRAAISVSGVLISLGDWFPTIVEAEAAYLAARKKYFGEE